MEIERFTCEICPPERNCIHSFMRPIFPCKFTFCQNNNCDLDYSFHIKLWKTTVKRLQKQNDGLEKPYSSITLNGHKYVPEENQS